MLSDEDIWRPGPPRPYRPTQACLYVPLNAVEETILSLRRAGRLESSVFWYGPRDKDVATVAAVLTPRQVMARGNYHVNAAAMSEMVREVDDDWRPLAQIHSHPGRNVEHSTYDDRMASSRKALSIVFPFYGHWSGPWASGIGVHEWQDDYWHLLSEQDAARRVRIATASPLISRDFRR